MAIGFSSPERFAVVLVAFVLLATGCGHAQRPVRSTAAALVPVITTQQGTVFPRTTLSGIVAPLQNVGITSSLTEPTDAVYVKEGDQVHRGQVLALLDTADLRAQLAADLATANSYQAKATQTYDQAGLTIAQNSNTVNSARAAVRQAEQTLATDTRNLQRDATLLRNGYVAQQTYDTQATLVKNDQQALRAAQVTLQNDISQVRANGTVSSGLQGATVSSARADTQMALAQADQIRVQIAKASIVSPIDGIVVNRNLNPGEFPGTRQLFTVQETDHVYAVLNGAASQIVGITSGAAVNVSSANLPGKQFAGKVEGVLNAINPGSTNFIVKVVIANPSGTLRPGMVVSGMASLPSASGVRVPATAFLDTTNSTLQTVSNGVVHTVKVTMIAQDARNAIVSGLSPGVTVVTNGQLGLSEGQTVQPQLQVAEK
jgi:multidrug efflux pump subunit AcrA (membrane-fusion protein)